MHHVILLTISFLGSLLFNSKFVTNISNYVIKKFGLDESNGYALSIFLYTLIIYSVSCFIGWIIDCLKRKEGAKKLIELNNRIDEIQKENKFLKEIFVHSMNGINNIESNISPKHKAKVYINNFKSNLNEMLSKMPEGSLMLDMKQIFLEREAKGREIQHTQVNIDQ